MKVTLDIPDTMEQTLHNQVGRDLERAAKESLAIAWYESDKISVGQVAEILGISTQDAEAMIKEFHVHAAVSRKSGNGRESFLSLANEWKRERGFSSKIRDLVVHPAYQRIIGMGSAAVPCLLSEMERKPDHWAWALRAITGVDPVPPSSRGKLLETAKAWIEWGRAHGYR
jgi:hypothetical protein